MSHSDSNQTHPKLGDRSVVVTEPTGLKLDRNLVQRLLTVILIGPGILAVVLWGGTWFAGMLALLAFLGLVEFFNMVRRRPNRFALMLGALAYIGLPLLLLGELRSRADGREWVLALLFTNWGTDMAAYAAGRLFGRHRLAPAISPNKTIEGALGGMLVGFLCGLVVLAAAGMLTPRGALFAALIAPACVLGDLLESAIKRYFSVKDAGHLLPGHGGVLDRIDGTLLAAVVGWLLLALSGG